MLALSAFTGSLMAPFTKVIELQASRYTYYACRECAFPRRQGSSASNERGSLRFFSMCFVYTSILATGTSPLGQPANRPWFFLFGCAMWFFLWACAPRFAEKYRTTQSF